MQKFIGIIPARYQSSRFPGKPLCDILGKPMIEHVYNSVKKWTYWKKVYVATDNSKIFDICEKLGIPVLITGEKHIDCLDRAAEVVKILEKRNEGADKYIIIQGDEPLFDVRTLDVDMEDNLINFYTEIQDEYDIYDNNAVKVVVSKHSKAIYFSRYTIPYHDKQTKRKDIDLKIYKQIGVYVFSGELLRKYSELESSYLEQMEGIGLNRFIENDIPISMRYTSYDSISVDTFDDRERIISILRKKYNKRGMIIDNNGKITKKCENKTP